MTLQTTKALLPWSENLTIMNHNIDAIACKAIVDPSRVNRSYNYSRAKWIIRHHRVVQALIE